MGAAVGGVEGHGAGGDGGAAAYVVADDDGFEQVQTRAAVGFGGGERGGDDGAAGVGEGGGVGVVGLVGVGEHAVGQGRVDGGGDGAAAEDAGLPPAALGCGIADGEPAGRETRP